MLRSRGGARRGDRHRVGPARRLLGEEAGERRLPRVGGLLAAPLGEELLALGGGEERQLREPAGRAPPTAPASRVSKVPGEALQRRRRRRGRGCTPRPRRARRRVSARVKVRSNFAVPRPSRTGVEREAGQLERRLRRVLEGEHHLEERASGWRRARAPAPRPASRTGGPGGRRRRAPSAAPAPRSSRKVGSPARSARRTRVLTKKPISPSISPRVRLAIGEPTARSSCPASARGGPRRRRGES